MMKKKKRLHFSMRFWVILLLLIEIVGITVLGRGIENLFHYIFKIAWDAPSLLWAILISIVLGTLLTTFISKWVFQPVVRLRQAMSRVAEGDFQVRLEEKHWFRDIQGIFQDFNRMTGELQATEILQTDFVSNVSHEFKTPITAIEGYAMLLQDSEEPITEEQRRYVEKILFNTQRLSNLVGNILLLSKVDNQTILTKPNTYRLDEQIRQSILGLEAEWVKKDVEFDVNLDPVEYTGHENLLIHVWNNLIANAIKFGPRGGVIGMDLSQRDGKIYFSVSDQGPGISPQAMNHVFDRFYQSDSSHKEEGNGLGLALVKQILGMCDGTVSVENLPEGGCRFTVVLERVAGE